MKIHDTNKMCDILITLYVLFILWFCVLSRTEAVHEVRYIGWSLWYMWNCWWMGYLFLQTIGNVLLYIQLGFLATYRFGEIRFKLVALRCCLTCMGIEGIQYLKGCGTLDFDNMINNLIGVGLGYLCYKMITIRRINVGVVCIVIAYSIIGLRIIWLNFYR